MKYNEDTTDFFIRTGMVAVAIIIGLPLVILTMTL